MLGQSTTATSGTRDATGAFAGGVRDAIIGAVVVGGLVQVLGVSDACANEVSAKVIAISAGGGLGFLTAIRKSLADLFTTKPPPSESPPVSSL